MAGIRKREGGERGEERGEGGREKEQGGAKRDERKGEARGCCFFSISFSLPPSPEGSEPPSPPRGRAPECPRREKRSWGRGAAEPTRAHGSARLLSASRAPTRVHEGTGPPTPLCRRDVPLPNPAATPLRTARDHPTAAPPRVGPSPRRALSTADITGLCCPDTPRHGHKAPRVDEQQERRVLNALAFPHIITHFSRKKLKLSQAFSTHGRSQPAQPRALRGEPSLPYTKVNLGARCPGGAEPLGSCVADALCQPSGTTATPRPATTQAHTGLRDVLSSLRAPRSAHSEAQHSAGRDVMHTQPIENQSGNGQVHLCEKNLPVLRQPARPLIPHATRQHCSAIALLSPEEQGFYMLWLISSANNSRQRKKKKNWHKKLPLYKQRIWKEGS